LSELKNAIVDRLSLTPDYSQFSGVPRETIQPKASGYQRHEMIKFTYNSGQKKPSLRPPVASRDDDISPTGLSYSEVERELITEHLKLKESINMIQGRISDLAPPSTTQRD
jgi:hypothetical protein